VRRECECVRVRGCERMCVCVCRPCMGDLRGKMPFAKAHERRLSMTLVSAFELR